MKDFFFPFQQFEWWEKWSFDVKFMVIWRWPIKIDLLHNFKISKYIFLYIFISNDLFWSFQCFKWLKKWSSDENVIMVWSLIFMNFYKDFLRSSWHGCQNISFFIIIIIFEWPTKFFLWPTWFDQLKIDWYNFSSKFSNSKSSLSSSSSSSYSSST